MLRLLIPVIIIAIIAIVVLVIHKRESQGAKAKRLEQENVRLKELVESLDSTARAEYAVTNSTFAWNVTDKIIDYKQKNKEIA